VANNTLGVNASQKNLFGNGIGTFNDRIRDGIRAAARLPTSGCKASLPDSLPTRMPSQIKARHRRAIEHAVGEYRLVEVGLAAIFATGHSLTTLADGHGAQ